MHDEAVEAGPVLGIVSNVEYEEEKNIDCMIS